MSLITKDLLTQFWAQVINKINTAPYAGSATAGGAANSAVIANTIVGGSANPISNDLCVNGKLYVQNSGTNALQLTYDDATYAYVDAENGRALGLRSHNGTDNVTGLIINTQGKVDFANSIDVPGYSSCYNAFRLMHSDYGAARFRISQEGTTSHSYLTANGTDIIFRVADGSTTGLTINTSGNTTIHGTLTANSSISGSSLTVTGDVSAKRCFLSAPSSVTNSANVFMASSGQLCKSSSLRAIKTDIEDITEKEATLGYSLKPRAFKGIQKGLDDYRQYGFVAEEVQEVLPDLATKEDGKLQGVAYDRVCAILLKQNQMQKLEIEELKARVEELEKKLNV